MSQCAIHFAFVFQITAHFSIRESDVHERNEVWLNDDIKWYKMRNMLLSVATTTENKIELKFYFSLCINLHTHTHPSTFNISVKCNFKLFEIDWENADVIDKLKINRVVTEFQSCIPPNGLQSNYDAAIRGNSQCTRYTDALSTVYSVEHRMLQLVQIRFSTC